MLWSVSRSSRWALSSSYMLCFLFLWMNAIFKIFVRDKRHLKGIILYLLGTNAQLHLCIGTNLLLKAYMRHRNKTCVFMYLFSLNMSQQYGFTDSDIFLKYYKKPCNSSFRLVTESSDKPLCGFYHFNHQNGLYSIPLITLYPVLHAYYRNWPILFYLYYYFICISKRKYVLKEGETFSVCFP